MTTDIRINDQGTIVLLHPRTAEATDWIAEHCDIEGSSASNKVYRYTPKR